MFEPLQKFIPKAANHYGISREMQAAEICHYFRNLIPDIFSKNPSAEENISPAHYKKNTLTINVSNPAWAQEVIIRKPKIIAAMNEKAGKEIIKELHTQLKSSQED